MFGYDPEVPAGFQDADILQAQYERESAEARRDRERGICNHSWGQGWREPDCGHPPLTEAEVAESRKRGDFPDRPTERLPRKGEVLCLDCGVIRPDRL